MSAFTEVLLHLSFHCWCKIWTGWASEYDLPEFFGHAAIDGEVDAAVEDEQNLQKNLVR